MLFRYVLAVSLGLCGCSIVVDYSEAPTRDEGTPDSGNTVLDFDGGDGPVPVAHCGPVLSNTLTYIPVDGDATKFELASSIAGGATMESLQLVQGALEAAELVTVNGPTDCGQAVSFAADQRLLRMPQAQLSGVASVDFWFELGELQASRVGLVVKDHNGPHDGDLDVSLIASQESGHIHVLMRLQRLTDPQGTYYLCSQAIAMGQWHHVAISTDGVSAELYVDGRVADTDININDHFGGASCRDTGSSAKEARMSDSQHDWLFGASNSNGPNPVANRLMGNGAIDEMRFRGVGFSEAEAKSVFGSGR